MDAVVEIFAFRLGAAPSPAKQDLAYRKILRGDPCCYCGKPSEVTDHIGSLWVTQEDHWTNFTAACKRCNSSKSSRSVLAFLSGFEIGLDHREMERRRLRAYYDGLAA